MKLTDLTAFCVLCYVRTFCTRRDFFLKFLNFTYIGATDTQIQSTKYLLVYVPNFKFHTHLFSNSGNKTYRHMTGQTRHHYYVLNLRTLHTEIKKTKANYSTL